MSIAPHRLIVAVLLVGLATSGTGVVHAHALYDYDRHTNTAAAKAPASGDDRAVGPAIESSALLARAYSEAPITFASSAWTRARSLARTRPAFRTSTSNGCTPGARRPQYPTSRVDPEL